MTYKIVALTGGIGSGKSTVANAFSILGVPLVDSDMIARQLLQIDKAALRAITQYFGSAVLNPDGSLYRAALRERIFRNKEEKIWLNNFLHPLIQEQTKQQFNIIQAPYILWVVPLLFENNLQKYANRVLVVDVDREIQITRTLRRDSVSREQLESIIQTQVSRQIRLAYADDIIDNSGRPEEIMERVARLHRCYLARAALVTPQDKSP
ncbi:dephospho-CoA kinase [Candidatus Steffania adelgidicola]|uniref:dephospho-CoA kinase n=1 Tax=Candidatus Steffania adelgidicola TaxID=1076626 RepID=UPI001D007841|nr:dephospho-CoA kinase [Candidatus Steffania adelgidicola]UDG80145.1 Dephospho-CoA kinase [Candidatus Steffania adelgidicola]